MRRTVEDNGADEEPLLREDKEKRKRERERERESL